MGNKKLSIITINYNNAEGLRMTMESVLKQTYRNIEYIVIDGASKDGSVEVIRGMSASLNDGMSRDKSLNDGMSLIWSSEKDNGIYNAMNKGIRKATGDFIQILNSGDILAADDVTERMMNALHSLTRSSLNEDAVSILYGNMLKSYDGKKILNRDVSGGHEATDSFFYFYKGTLNHDCAYIRRDLFNKYGLYNEQMKICSDWEWYVRAIAFGGEKAVYTNIDVTIFDMNGVSENGGKNADLIKKERREFLESILPASVLKDYDTYAAPINEYNRLKRHHLWGLIWFVERVLFKLEKWHVLH